MGRKAITNEVFVERMSIINPNIILLTKYIRRTQKIKCKCKICGHEWETYPCNLLDGYGCRNCLALATRKSHEDFLEEMKHIHKDIVVIGKYVNAKTKILVRCDICGWEWYSSPDNLINNHRGCPNCKKSFGELAIKDYLDKNRIDYIPQKKFDKLLGIYGRNLSYDYYLPQYNMLIEFQGKQHEKPIEYFGGEETFKNQQEHDRRKKNYAQKHNINLLEIWYWDFKNIETILNSWLLLQSD